MSMYAIPCPKCSGSGRVPLPTHLQAILEYIEINPFSTPNQTRMAIFPNDKPSAVCNRFAALEELGLIMAEQVPTGRVQYQWATRAQFQERDTARVLEAFGMAPESFRSSYSYEGYRVLKGTVSGINYEFAFKYPEIWLEIDEYIPGRSSRQLRWVGRAERTTICGDRGSDMGEIMANGLERLGRPEEAVKIRGRYRKVEAG